MLLVCSKCWELATQCDCGSSCIEIDDNIYPAIKRLNLLGYKTKFCCEGHADNHILDIYIYFDCMPNEKMFETLPEGWTYESYTYKKTIHYKYNIIRGIDKSLIKKIVKMTKKQKQEIINNRLKSLIKWVNELPLKE